ncbi:hypothetical protein [Sorangium sp. So ce341]|uniref:hypothetical protein n=1 Tax=Sorangium sp. So ce341 TaxID=3133302 RepID=UPI003F5FB010
MDNIAPERNEYGSNPSYVRWAGVDGADEYRNRSVCGTFVTHTLRRAHGFSTSEIDAWFGSTSPNAARYHDTIAAEIGFRAIRDVRRIAAGDILAVKYPGESAPSGHVGILAGPAEERAPTAPLVPGTAQYAVEILDSSSSGHGETDTRRNPDGSWHDGAGAGVMRLYADEDGQIAGYTWSEDPSSVYHPTSDHALIVGKLR